MTGEVHRIAVAVLVRDDRVLLGHRHPQRLYYPDCWDAVGGHIEAGETPEQALVRECREELGVTVTGARPVGLAVDDPSLEMHAFVVESWTGTPGNCAPEEHDDLRWFRRDQVAGLRLAHPALDALIASATDWSGPLRP